MADKAGGTGNEDFHRGDRFLNRVSVSTVSICFSVTPGAALIGMF
jgi:hypothetical protein